MAENNEVDVCASLSCSSVMAVEKDASEAIRSVVAALPNIQTLKPEQEQSLIPHGVCLIFQLASLVVELAEANASDWLRQIQWLWADPIVLKFN